MISLSGQRQTKTTALSQCKKNGSNSERNGKRTGMIDRGYALKVRQVAENAFCLSHNIDQRIEKLLRSEYLWTAFLLYPFSIHRNRRQLAEAFLLLYIAVAYIPFCSNVSKAARIIEPTCHASHGAIGHQADSYEHRQLLRKLSSSSPVVFG